MQSINPTYISDSEIWLNARTNGTPKAEHFEPLLIALDSLDKRLIAYLNTDITDNPLPCYFCEGGGNV